MPPDSGHTRDLDGAIAKGALINALGTIGKLLFPAYFVMVTRLYGPTEMGIYYIAYVILEVVGYLTVSGINDGVVMFGARYGDDRDDEHKLYTILANGFAITGGIAAVLLVAGQLVGPLLLRGLYPKQDLVPAFRIMLLALPFTVFGTVAIAATRALIMMQWEALIINFLRPAALVVFTLVWYLTGNHSVTGLAWCYLGAMAVTALAASIVFARYFSYAKLARRIVHFELSAPLIKFAIPQNLNMTFNHFITNVDVVMLGYFKVQPALIAFYGMGAQIVANIRQIQTAFSGVFAPVIPRLHKAGDTAGLSRRLAMVSRWAVSIAIPAGLLLLFFRQELVRIFHGSFTGDTTFMVLLCVRPIISCAIGMSGNVLVMTGHSLWNLLNSIAVATGNVVLNYLLIPKYGLNGAALATMISSLTVTFATVIEMRLLVGARVLVAKIYKPFLAAIPGIMALVYFSAPDLGVATRIGWCVGSLGLYAALLSLLGLEIDDKQMLRRLFRLEEPGS